MLINKPLVAAVGAVNQQIMLASGNDGAKYVLNANGAGIFAKLAKTLVGNGQGELKFVLALSDLPSIQYLFDGDGGANRCYAYVNGTTDTVSTPSAGVNTVINRGGVNAVYGEVVEFLTTGDFSGLELATLLSRYSEAEFAKAVPISFSYKDGIGTSQDRMIEFDFLLDKPQRHVLPVGEKPSRNLVTQNAVTTWDGTEADWASKDLGLTLKQGKVYQVKVTPHKGATNNIRFAASQFNGAWTPVSLNGEAQDYIWSPDSDRYVAIQTQFGSDKFIGTVEVEVREVSNALILKGLTANIADAFEAVVQRGDGHWHSAKNIAVNSPISFDGTEPDYWTKNAGFDLELGEWYSIDAQRSSDSVGQYQIPAFGYWANFDDRRTVELQSDRTAAAYVQANIDPNRFVGTVKVAARHVIRLSDYLLKQHQIQQIKGAVEGYRAKAKTGYRLASDGVNDKVSVEPITVNGDCDIYGWFSVDSLPSSNEAIIGGTGGSSPSAGAFCIFLSPSGNLTTQHPLDVGAEYLSQAFEVGLINFYHYKVRDDQASITCNSLTKEATKTNRQPIEIALLNCWSTNLNFAGVNHGCVVIDHENPLPIGQGGNSCFWPLDGSTATAEQKLGLDKKGAIIVKEGVGLGPELFSGSALILSADGASTFENGVLETSETDSWTASYIEVEQDKYFYFEAEIWLDPDHPNNFIFQGGNTSNHRMIFSSSFTPNAVDNWVEVSGVLKAENQGRFFFVGNGAHTLIKNISLKEAYGFGSWKGLSAELDEIKSVNRNADGALVGESIIDAFTVANQESSQEGETVNILSTDGSFSGVFTPDGSTPPGEYRISGVADVREGAWQPTNRLGGAIGVDGQAESGAFSIDVTTSNGLGLKRGSGVTDIVLSNVKVERIIRLSAELQRQHDLAIAEKQIAKLIKKAEKSQTLLSGDAVNDKVTIPAIAVGEPCVITTWFTKDSTYYKNLFGANHANAFELLMNTSAAVWLSGGPSTVATAPNVWADSMLHRLDLEVFDDLTFEVKINHERVLDYDQPIGERYITEFGGHSNNNNDRNWDGKLGCLAYLNKKNPKDSRFYAHTKEGFKDQLHSDGSKDGNYVGLSAGLDEIQSFKKRGDDWITDLWVFGDIVLDGSEVLYNQIAGKSADAVPENTDLEITLSWVNLVGRIRVLCGASGSAVTSIYSEPNTGSLTVIANTSAQSRLYLQTLVEGTTADKVSVSVKHTIKGA